MRTIVRGTPACLATSDATRLTSSLLVTATTSSHPSSPRVVQHAGMGAAALNGEHVELGREVAEAVGVDVDHGDVVALPAEASRYVGPDLTGPYDDHMHG